jgi:glutamate-1-semialdehyde 2,1-aminomutase
MQHELEASKAAAARAQGSVAGGLARPALAFPPPVVFADRGEGCYLFDLDGNRYLDFHNNFTALAIGHRHPHVAAALTEQLARGTTFGAPTVGEAGLAELIVSRVKSVERVTFTNSGTEAAATALALARAYTGRQLVAKFEGGYHGWDATYVSVRQNIEGDNGPYDQPLTVRNSSGLAPRQAELMVTLPFNNVEAAADILGARAKEVAAIVIEPYQSVGGGIVPEPGFLENVQLLSRRLDIPLILDEIVTLRLAAGGAQQIFGLEPDLTLMGKIIGGGLPVGGVGGRKEIMDLMAPAQGPAAIAGSGTFTGNPMTTAAGRATLEVLTAAEIDRLNRLGQDLQGELESFCRRHELPVQMTGIGSLVNFHFNERAIRMSRDTWTSNRARGHAFLLAMRREGYYMTGRVGLALSTPMTETDLEGFVEAATRHLPEVCAA